ncbi:NAD(P)/FAD-dependent oxidoreductase [Brevundimonas sp.]|uniref:flavin monoamine oxidase family protein n=1 Tax=Brevundimonas sp. TaxID=1871086 RepID=UPI002D3B1BB8|nr:NAD(P)/FAD-dependent oxidoreductase [Brevundimonas sp.]HYD27336.1 NAD(P)/FAD-dependent oxidoreductase [Brevundimonas sp.]
MRLTRRSLLAGFGAAAVSGCGARAVSEPDVVVIGAGSAGIAAALTARAAGLDVVVLEAMDRIGGRAFTDTATFGSPFDVGCAWLHKADDNPYADYARAQGFTLRAHEYDLEKVWLGPRPAPAHLVNAAEEAMSEAIAGAPADVAASTVVDLAAPVDEAAGDYLGALDMAVDLDELSTFDYANADDLAPNLLCAQGFGAIVAHRGRGLPVRLNTPVRHVRWDGPGATVETDAGSIHARAVIVTASTGVLASGAIRFTPDLPVATRDAIADIPMGMLAKIPLQIRGQRFGLEPFTDVLLARRGRRDLYFLSFPFATDLMVGFVGGDLGWELSAAGEAAAIDFATQGLVEMFGSNAAAAVVRGGLTPWASNPWTRGAYAAASPGRYAAREALARPVGDRIFFAGEALAGGLIQTCGGAYRSGEAAARAVRAVLA